MDNEEAIVQLALALAALQARTEVTDAVVAALIETHPNPGAVLAQWQPVVAKATSEIEMQQAIGEQLHNDTLREANESAVALWRDVLLGARDRASRR
jgi:hypothetical protein